MTMVLLPLLMHRHPCYNQDGIVSLVTMAFLPLIRNGIVVIIVIALLPSLSWHHCPCCNGIVVMSNAQASLPSLQWCHCPCCNGFAAINAQASSQLLQLQL
jgi:hypothetical protein